MRWLLGSLTTLVALTSVCYLDVDAWLLLALTATAVVASLLRPSWLARVPRQVHTLAFPVVLGAFAFDYYTFRELLPALVRLGILLLLYRSLGYRRRRDDLQLILLALFLVVTAGVLTVSIGFAPQIALFAALALGLLLTRTLVDAAESGGPETGMPPAGNSAPEWTRVNWGQLLRRLAEVSDWRVWAFSVALFCGLVLLSGFLFLAIPRFQLNSSLFLDRWMNKGSLSGFTDTLHFGEVSNIQKDESVAFRVSVNRPELLPEELYWRMTVMDEYRDRAFRMSPALKARNFGRELTLSGVSAFGLPVVAGPAQWTFYLEPGVSRYLPLTGGFRGLSFTEPQTFRASDRLRVLELSRDPATMKAYRIFGMDTTGVLREGRRDIRDPAAGAPEALFLQLPFNQDEQESWNRLVTEVSGGRQEVAGAFAEAAIAWLHRRHLYALQSKLPAGSGDPLLRWALSDQPGHCELFAGTFAMLARSAGFPCRVVGGFLGATWNEDYLIVRNSNAHAWCEIYDGEGRWLRVDPTRPPTAGASSAVARNEEDRAALSRESGWRARIDRLRMLWYRHIVNFEHRDQQNLVRSLKERTESSGKALRERMQEWLGDVRGWLARPWGLQRTVPPLLALAGAALLFWWWRRLGRNWWVTSRKPKPARLHPVRREAGRWLERFEQRGWRREEVDTDAAATLAQLQRLRFGREETWSPPAAVFRDARVQLRSLRRDGRRR